MRRAIGAAGPSCPDDSLAPVNADRPDMPDEPRGSGAGHDDERGPAPRWYRYVPFLGAPPALTRRQWRIMGLVAVVNIFDQYDLYLFSLALKQIQADLAIPEAQLGTLGAIVRMGALPALALGIWADRIGRRRVLFFTIVAYTVLTGATAFAPTAEIFVGLQFTTRIFAVAEVMLAYVVISEELDPEHRGWGVGALAALGALGNGMALVLFGFVDVLPMGWRSLYLIGLGPLVLIAWMRRSLPETRRFELHRSERSERAGPFGLGAALRPMLDLVRVYPARFIGVAAVIFLLNFAENPAGFFQAKFIQDEHGWTPGMFSLLGLTGGFVGITGSTFAGRLSDRFGRRRVAIVFLATHPAFVLGFYASAGAWVPVLWVGMVFSGIASGVVLGTYGNELFPTSYRSTASGARVFIATVGGVVGLQVEALIFGGLGDHWAAISSLAAVAFAAPFIVAGFFPETSGRTLEEISPERSA